MISREGTTNRNQFVHVSAYVGVRIDFKKKRKNKTAQAGVRREMDPPEPFDDSFVVDAVSSSPSRSIRLFEDADLGSDMTVKAGRSWRGQARQVLKRQVLKRRRRT
jgi:hypothetical protein